MHWCIGSQDADEGPRGVITEEKRVYFPLLLSFSVVVGWWHWVDRIAEFSNLVTPGVVVRK